MTTSKKKTEQPEDAGLVADPAAAAAAAQPGAPQQVNLQIHLRKIPLLAELTDEEMLRVKADLRIRQYAKRDIVLQKGAAGDSLLFLLTGQLQVIDVTEDGRAIGLRMLAPGDFFGEIAVINGSMRSASVVALTPVLVALLPRSTALHLFSHSPSVANHMLRFLAEKVQRDSEFRALLSIHNTSRRIYTFIDLLKEKKDGDVHVVENLPTHQDIANMINTSRETVTRTLLTLVQQGIVQKGTHRLIIVNPEALQKLAQG
ncbi:Crp/Fnr family transcriptional regulator [Massilia sp. BJB1822]|uniref:Crp/Fnr family transcriptional regulator n=1 Tax=Massilia sp. BJB1822 TaxID=2744470 RepID=UPI001594B533|nr:Crp/Fnr family transcriptional regulator [Massilia sp. BJB1822]NVE01400.1 Crp/Fnr family transcriptional regulator [Massilia sp. BJB1822]